MISESPQLPQRAFAKTSSNKTSTYRLEHHDNHRLDRDIHDIQRQLERPQRTEGLDNPAFLNQAYGIAEVLGDVLRDRISAC